MQPTRLMLSLRFALAFGIWTLAVPAWARPGIAVIVARDASVRRLDRATLRDIYLKKIFVDDRGRTLIPVNLPADHPLRRAFSLDLLGATSEELQNYWNERYFHGIRPPYVLGSQNAVVQFVVRTPGAIGYVVTCKVNASVREIMILPVPDSQRTTIDHLCARP